jgi:hypothetical protein
MNQVLEKPAATDEPQMIAPKVGEHFRCQKCGLEIEITANCKGTGGHHARFECCGQPLTQMAECDCPS